MTIEKARKLALTIYTAAFVLFLLRMLTQVSAVVQNVLIWIFFALVFIGFAIGSHFCRCPYCGRGLKVGFGKINGCPFCKATITSESKWDDLK